jgi:hypothetical protein
MAKDVEILTPVAVAVTGFLGIGATLLIQESGAEWIHSVWVVIGISLLVDMHYQDSFPIKIRRLIRKISALFMGLCLGVACGFLVRGLYSWDSPRWIILVLRLLVECLLLLGSAIVAQWTQKVSSSELALVCLASSLALFCPSANLAIARVVGILFACAITLFVLVGFWLATQGRSKKKYSLIQIDLIENVIALCTKVIRGADNDKEEIEKLVYTIMNLLSSRGILNRELEGHIKPLVYECLSLYWSVVSGAVTPFIHQQSPSLFCTSPEQFDRYFRPSLERIEDGLDGVRNDLLVILAGSGDCSLAIEQLVNQWIEGNLVEGIQGMEFHFAQTSKTVVFLTQGQRWHMASYLVNLGTMLSSLIAFVQCLIPQSSNSRDVDSLTNTLNRISSIQKMGSYSYLLDLSVPLVASTRTSSAAISPIVAGRHSLLSSQSCEETLHV